MKNIVVVSRVIEIAIGVLFELIVHVGSKKRKLKKPQQNIGVVE